MVCNAEFPATLTSAHWGFTRRKVPFEQTSCDPPTGVTRTTGKAALGNL